MGARLINYSESVRMTTELCITCGVVFGMPEELTDRRRQNHASFYCPNGHSMVYSGESDKARADRLQAQLEAAQNAQRFAERRLADEQDRQKKELERIAKRSHAGVCQECHRTFQNVVRHMKTKHGA